MVHIHAASATVAAAIVSAAAAGVALGVYISRGSNATNPAPRRRLNYPKRLILVRHGESEGNIDPLLYCTVPDNAMHLTALGFEQAVAAGRSIKKIIGAETVRFIVSPYTRTIETFQGITKAWGCSSRDIPWHEEPRIREQDFGNFQDPVKIREAKSQRRRFGSFFYRFPSGESPADVYDRISSFLESLYRLFEKSTEENYVLVTHGVSIRVILTRYFKYRICEFEQLDNFHNGEFVVLEFDDKQCRYALAKVVSNRVTLKEDGTAELTDTKEYHALRVHSMEALSSTLAPYPTSPIHHFRRASSAVFPPPSPAPATPSSPGSGRPMNGTIPEDSEMLETASSTSSSPSTPATGPCGASTDLQRNHSFSA